MSSARQDVLVLGAGVSGLTTAVCLAEAGVPVHVLTSDMPTDTTSCAAGAMWGPLLVDGEEVESWSSRTLAELTALAEYPETGVRLVGGIEACRKPLAPALPVTRIADFRYCLPDELPDGYAAGWRYTAPLIDMPVYLDYLAARLRACGVRIELGRVASLEELVELAPVTINCTGFGACRLVPDPQVRPVRGHLVVAENPGLSEYFAEYTEDETDMTYLLPMGRQVILGGSAEPGTAELEPDPATFEGIVHRCVAIEPRLRGVRIIGHRVGIRPARHRVRVEHVPVGRRHLIHNYGHGGAGVSLSWGCALTVRDLVLALR